MQTLPGCCAGCFSPFSNQYFHFLGFVFVSGDTEMAAHYFESSTNSEEVQKQH